MTTTAPQRDPGDGGFTSAPNEVYVGSDATIEASRHNDGCLYIRILDADERIIGRVILTSDAAEAAYRDALAAVPAPTLRAVTA